MDTLFPGLTAHSSTRDLLAHLTGLYQAGGDGLSGARQALHARVGELATGDGAQRQFPLTLPGRTLSIAELFSPMDAAQAGRFVDELFDDIVPHVSDKHAVLRSVSEGATAQGTPLSANPLARLMAGLLSRLPQGILDRNMIIQAQQLTWVDDHVRAIASNVSFEFAAPPSEPPHRGMKF